MPIRLPNKPRAEVIRDKRLSAANENLRIETRRKSNATETIDWLALWAISIAISAMFGAGLVYFSESDVKGAAAILAGAAIIIAVALFASKLPSERR